ncbi:MAG: NAD(P)-dependent dehydrogenase (short-subunit alcohol dehydrogenase family) [Candidatus Aldehydirespiratoraceae bacterium]|jgi:NAD(P)-dependent dehydrogenase (short-subunit alcohol dehydrogenase family)
MGTMTTDPQDVPPIDDWNRLLEGKVAVVTGGGAEGIGGAITELFAAHGATVEVAEIDRSRAEAVVNTVTETGGSARAHVVDVCTEEGVEALASAVLETHGGIDVLVNNVGDYRPAVRFDVSGPESWEAMYRINLWHMFAVTQAFLTPMIERGGGSIVNVHSVEGMRGYPGEPVYAAMKSAAAHFTTSLAVGYGRRGIRANGIGVDLTQTPQVDYISGYENHEELWESWAPVGRLGWPTDQARVALFLASDMSSYVTGHNVAADGGTKAGGGWFFSPNDRRFMNRSKTL